MQLAGVKSDFIGICTCMMSSSDTRTLVLCSCSLSPHPLPFMGNVAVPGALGLCERQLREGSVTPLTSRARPAPKHSLSLQTDLVWLSSWPCGSGYSRTSEWEAHGSRWSGHSPCAIPQPRVPRPSHVTVSKGTSTVTRCGQSTCQCCGALDTEGAHCPRPWHPRPTSQVCKHQGT